MNGFHEDYDWSPEPHTRRSARIAASCFCMVAIIAGIAWWAA